jgi:hypothetical protein
MLNQLRQRFNGRIAHANKEMSEIGIAMPRALGSPVLVFANRLVFEQWSNHFNAEGRKILTEFGEHVG